MTGLPVPGPAAGRPSACVARSVGPSVTSCRWPSAGASASGSSGSCWPRSAGASGRTWSTEFPTFADIIRTIFPGVDLASAGWFLQLVFVEMGLIVVGFSAATFVSRWASDEESGRLEMLLDGAAHATGLDARRWHRRGPRGGALDPGLCARDRARRGLRRQRGRHPDGRHRRPSASYAAAMVGVGVAIGGLWRTSWAAELVAALVIVTFLINLLAPALQLPDWVQQLALTAHLGQPMIGTGTSSAWRPASSSPLAGSCSAPGACTGATSRFELRREIVDDEPPRARHKGCARGGESSRTREALTRSPSNGRPTPSRATGGRDPL